MLTRKQKPHSISPSNPRSISRQRFRSQNPRPVSRKRSAVGKKSRKRSASKRQRSVSVVARKHIRRRKESPPRPLPRKLRHASSSLTNQSRNSEIQVGVSTRRSISRKRTSLSRRRKRSASRQQRNRSTTPPRKEKVSFSMIGPKVCIETQQKQKQQQRFSSRRASVLAKENIRVQLSAYH